MSDGLLPEGALLLDDRFRVVRQLGQGGMGVVYLAHQVSLGRTVAVKVLRDDLGAQPGMVERFRREAQLLSSVEHPAVVRVIDFGTQAGALCLVMEYVDGTMLEQVVAQGPLPVERALTLLFQLAQGLAAIHARGIVHRDLKAENVVLTQTPQGEQARLLDFGIARLAEPDVSDPTANVTQVGLVVGTPSCLSPEQALGHPLDARSDLYSFGVLAYQTLSGRLPFDGPGPRDYIRQHVQEEPRPLLEVAPHLGAMPQLVRVVMQCLQKDPAARPQTAALLVEAFAQLLGRANTAGFVVSPLLLTEAKPAATGRPRWHRPAAIGVGVLALTLALASVWLAPARRARRLIDTRRASEALQVLEDADGELPDSVQMQLKAAALYQLNRSAEARELLKGFKADDEAAPLEPLVVEALAEDFGRKEVPSVRELLKGVPKARALPVLQELAQDEKGRAQWGALRFVDLEYAGQGLPLVALYARALQSSDCGVRNLAAKRLGELKNPEAVPALEALRELPRRKGTFSDDDCGQTQAANAVRAIRKDQL